MAEPNEAIHIREYERAQLCSFLPEVIEIYNEHNLDATANDLQSYLDELSEPIDGHEERYEFGSDGWRDITTGLEELDETRASWLRSKIGRRAELSTAKMGFTTSVPFMSMYLGEKPTKPES